MSSTARNVLIILAVAAVVAFTPTGGDAATVAGRALSLAFTAVFALGAVWVYRNNRLTIETLEPGLRTALYCGVAGLVLAAAGYSWLTATSGRSLVFIVLVAASVTALVVVWQRSRDLS